MTTQRITELRTLANKHKATHKSAMIILECLDDIEKLQRLYCIALDYGYGGYRTKAVSLSKLKALAESPGNGKEPA